MDLHVLEDGQFARLLAAEWTSKVGDFALLPVIPFSVFALGGSATQAAIVFCAEFAAGWALVLFGGVIGDRYPRREVMIWSDLIRFAIQIFMAALFLAGAASILWLVVTQLVLGAAGAFFRPALQGLIPQTVANEVLQEANALRGLALAASTAIGPAVGGLFLLLGDPGWAFAVNGLTFALSAAFLWGLRPLPGLKAEEEVPVLQGLTEGWDAFRSRTWLWAVVVFFGIFNALTFAPYFTLGPERIDSESIWTAVLVAEGIGAVVGCAVVLRWKPQRPLLAACAAVGLWIPLGLLVAFDAALVLLLPAAVVAGIGLAIFGAFWETCLMGHVPEDQISRLASYDWLGGMGLLPIGYAFAAVAAATVGAEAGLLVGVVVIAIGVPRLVTIKSIKDLPLPPTT